MAVKFKAQCTQCDRQWSYQPETIGGVMLEPRIKSCAGCGGELVISKIKEKDIDDAVVAG